MRSHGIIDWGKQPVRSHAERAAILVALYLLIAARIPNAWIDGRFWAEDGAVFFARAWTMPWWQALFAPYADYLNITANFAGVLAAHLTRLETAPQITAAVAVLIQCIPAALLLTARDPWLQNRFVMLAAMLLIGLPPVPEEVWANAANGMGHLALGAGILLALEAPAGALGVTYAGVLLLAALSSPASWPLLPLFVARAVIDRSPARALQALVLFAGIAIQLVFFATLQTHQIGTNPAVLGAIVLARHVIGPLLGHGLAQVPIERLAAPFRAGANPLWPLVVVVSLFAVAAIVFLRTHRQTPLWFLLGAATIAGASYLGALDPRLNLIHAWVSARYGFPSQVLIGLAVLSWTALQDGRLRALGAALVAWLTIVGAYSFLVPAGPWFVSGARWPAEVARWRGDPGYALQIWPPGWTVTLPAR